MLAAGTLEDEDYPVAPAKVTFNHRVDPQKDRLTLGHEIGHLFINHGLGIPHVSSIDDDALFHAVEDFCEIFGREMVLPVSQLATVEKVDEKLLEEISKIYGADLETTIIQLMKAQRLPNRVFIDTKLPDNLNSDNSGRMVRRAICLDCQTQFGWGGCPDVTVETPVFDFLHKALGAKFGVCSSYVDIRWLNKAHS